MIKFLILFLFICNIASASPPTRAFTYVSNTNIDPAQVNTNENSLYSYLQTGVDTYAANSITGAAISASASIPYVSLSLSNSIVNADISSSAAILASKLDLRIPGAIGSTTPNSGAFTSLSSTSGTLIASLTGDVTGNLTGNVNGNVTGNITGNSTGTHTGSVALNGGTISGGTLGQENCETIVVSNNTDSFCTTGYYMRGQHRDADGSAGNLYCCKP